MKLPLVHVLFATAFMPLAGARASAQDPGREPVTKPALIVLLTVDQFQEPYLERYGAQFTGGLKRLLDGGAFYTNAFQDHAMTETAPGHASTLSGRFPRGTGIVTNTAGVGDPEAPLVGGGGPGASPFRFRGSTLIDWLRSSDPLTRALSVSRKDRGAILPLGRAHQQVFWYASDGRFTTSTYYADTLPSWVQRFNAEAVPQRYAGKAWTLLLPASAYPEPDSVTIENGGRDYVFPHVLPADPVQAARSFLAYPFMDQATLDLALDGVKALRLGAGPHTDVLAISLSTTDAIGHAFGPESREIHDQVLRLDRMLGVFLDSLFAHVDSTRVVIALTADHGITPFPELHAANAGEARAMHVELTDLLAPTRAALARAGGDTLAFRFEDGILAVDRASLRRARVDADGAIAAFVRAARAHPGVARVDLVANLAHEDTVHDTAVRRWLHMIPRDLPIEAVVSLKPGHVWGNDPWAEHGSGSDLDAHVPIVLYGRAFLPGRYTGFARVVDLAPTLAAVAGVRPTEPLDGHVLRLALAPAYRSAGAAAGEGPAAGEVHRSASGRAFASPTGDGALLVQAIAHAATGPLRWRRGDWMHLGLVTAGIAATGAADGMVRDRLQADRAEELDDVAHWAEPLGSVPSFGVLASFYAAGLVLHAPTERAVAVEGLAASVVAGGLFTPALKFVAGRSRPRSDRGTYDFRLFSNRPSFPSGHVTQAFAIASVVAAEHRSGIVKAGAYALASLVGFARMRHDAHFASDVVAAAFVGGVTGRSVAAFGRAHRASAPALRLGALDRGLAVQVTLSP